MQSVYVWLLFEDSPVQHGINTMNVVFQCVSFTVLYVLLLSD